MGRLGTIRMKRTRDKIGRGMGTEKGREKKLIKEGGRGGRRERKRIRRVMAARKGKYEKLRN